MAVFTFNDNFKINAPKHIDTRYLNLFTPWADVASANAGTPSAYRYLGLTVLIGTIEYWYQAGVADINLVPKTGAGTSVTANNGITLTGSNLQLGGTIIHDTLLDLTGTNFKLYINATSNTVSPFVVSNSGIATAILGQVTGSPGGAIAIRGVAGAGNIGVYGSASGATSVGVYGAATVGIAGYFTANTTGGAGISILVTGSANPLLVVSDGQPSSFIANNPSTVGTIPLIQVSRQTTAGTNGMGASFEYYLTQSDGNSINSTILISEFTNATVGAVDTQFRIRGVNASTLADKIIIGAPATKIISTRFEMAQGAAVAAANNLTLGVDGNLFSITGSTQINAITIANWQAGSEIAFIFTGTPLLKNNTAGGGGTAVLSLAGGVDYLAAAGDYIKFAYNGTVWKETTRRPAAGGSAGVFTANNGLSIGPVSSNVQLGGALTQITTISSNNFLLQLFGNNFTSSSSFINAQISGTSTISTIVGYFSNNQTVSGFTGSNTGIRGQASGSVLSNIGGSFLAIGGASSYGVQATADTWGVFGTGNIGVYGVPNATGQAGVKGDGTPNSVYGVWGVGTVGVLGEGAFGSGIGVWGQSIGGIPLLGSSKDTTSNTVTNALTLQRTDVAVPAVGLGIAIDYAYQTNPLGSGGTQNRLASQWVNATDGSQSSKFTLSGVTNGTSLTQWISVIGDGAQFYGTGTAIVAIAGTTGIFTVGTNFGGTFIGGAVGVQAINNSTSTNTVVTTLQSSRQGSSYLGAVGSGTQISFDSKNSTGAISITGLFRNYYTNATSGSEVTQFDFSLATGGVNNTVFTLTGLGKIIANRAAFWIVAANNAAAIAAGGVAGEFYRNGDIVQIVH